MPQMVTADFDDAAGQNERQKRYVVRACKTGHMASELLCDSKCAGLTQIIDAGDGHTWKGCATYACDKSRLVKGKSRLVK